jgi:hypothetical protein
MARHGGVDGGVGGGRTVAYGSFALDSAAGSRFADEILTVVASCPQQGRPLLAFLAAAIEAALRGSPSPSLLPAPQGS